MRIQASSAVLMVTGGSRRIGAATARLAAVEGYAVAVSYRQQRDAASFVSAACVDMSGGGFVVGEPLNQ